MFVCLQRLEAPSWIKKAINPSSESLSNGIKPVSIQYDSVRFTAQGIHDNKSLNPGHKSAGACQFPWKRLEIELQTCWSSISGTVDPGSVGNKSEAIWLFQQGINIREQETEYCLWGSVNINLERERLWIHSSAPSLWPQTANVNRILNRGRKTIFFRVQSSASHHKQQLQADTARRRVDISILCTSEVLTAQNCTECSKYWSCRWAFLTVTEQTPRKHPDLPLSSSAARLRTPQLSGQNDFHPL